MRRFSEEDIERAAKTAHGVNKAYCEGIGDSSLEVWELAPGWQKESAKDGVRSLINDPRITSEQSHRKWMEHKAMGGWTYGEVKNEDEKKHPCMVPYEDLPLQQRVKDDLFGFVVRAVLLLNEGE